MSLNIVESIDAVVESFVSLIMVITVSVAADTDVAMVVIVVGMMVGVEVGMNAVVIRVAIDIRSGITNSWLLLIFFWTIELQGQAFGHLLISNRCANLNA